MEIKYYTFNKTTTLKDAIKKIGDTKGISKIRILDDKVVFEVLE